MIKKRRAYADFFTYPIVRGVHSAYIHCKYLVNIVSEIHLESRIKPCTV